jgi:hypothetical protein
MNKNTIHWAYHSVNYTQAEIFQRLAFSFGYKWRGKDDPQEVLNRSSSYFVIDPVYKEITYSMDLQFTESCVFKITDDLYDALELFNTPPENSRKVGDFATVYRNGDVTFFRKLTSAEFDQVADARAKFSCKETKTESQLFPRCSFTYTGHFSGQRIRNILVLEDTDRQIRGLDCDDSYTFKSFSKEKIKGTISFLRFENKP